MGLFGRLCLIFYPGLCISVSNNTVDQGMFCDELDSVPLYYDLDFTLHIQPIFDFYGCSDCHNGSDGGLNLSSNNGSPLILLLGYTSKFNDQNLIEPHSPFSSYLFEKINCDSPESGSRMPQSGGSLTLDDQAIIYDWINQGALGEFPPGLWFRDIIYRTSFEGIRN